MSRWLVVAALLVAAVGAEPPAPNPPLRFWVDDWRFLPNVTSFLRRAIYDTNGEAVLVTELGGPQVEGHTLLVDDGPLPFNVYWSTTTSAGAAHKKSRAADVRICTVPGMHINIVPKDEMVDVITNAYGAQAFSIIPPSFRLPQSAAELRAYVEREEGAGADWVLKQLRHRGEGVHFLKGREVLQHERLSAEADKPYVVAQRLIDPQFSVLDGRICKMRVTVLIMGMLPSPRVYLYTDGSVHLAAPERSGAGPRQASRVVNSRQEGTMFLSLRQFRPLVDAACGSPAAWDRMVDTMARQVAALVAMTIDGVMEMSQAVPGAPGGFEILGVDVFLDRHLQPWVIEVNNDPEFGYKPDFGKYNDVKTDLFSAIVQALLLSHRARTQGVPHGAWTDGSTWVHRERQIMRAHRWLPLAELMYNADACSERLRAGGGGCQLLGPGWEAGGARECRLGPLSEVLLGSIATCPIAA